MSPTPATVTSSLALALCLFGSGCGAGSVDASKAWSGTIDTLASGEIVVRNTDEPLWAPQDAWRVVEELRVGSDTGDEARVFGDIISFDVNVQGQIYVLDFQAQEISIFDSDGSFVRAVGSSGTGPGEFEQAIAVDISRKGEIWVMEMLKGRLSIFDPDGKYLSWEPVGNPGVALRPYLGGFDSMGRYNAIIFSFNESEETQVMGRFDQSLTPLDTIAIPKTTKKRDAFTHVSDNGRASITATIPFQESFQWRRSPMGNLWTLSTGAYELVELAPSGETLRRVTREHEPLQVTEEDRNEARESFRHFISRGGTVDWSRVPTTKPATVSFFCDDKGNLWVKLEAATPGDEGHLFDLFDPGGRYLGEMRLPFSLQSNPEPIVKDGVLYGITTDEFGAPNVVRARIEKS